MSNLDRAANIIAEAVGDDMLTHAAAQALADAGLLKTEFAEKELSRLYDMEMVVERGIAKGWINEAEFEDFL